METTQSGQPSASSSGLPTDRSVHPVLTLSSRSCGEETARAVIAGRDEVRLIVMIAVIAGTLLTTGCKTFQGTVGSVASAVVASGSE